MMPGTTDSVVNHQSFRKRSVLVAAVRIDCEYLRADLHQKHFVISDMAKQLAFREIGGHFGFKTRESEAPPAVLR